MGTNIRSISSEGNGIRQDVFPLDQWTVTTKKGKILQSRCTCSRNDEANTSITNHENGVKCPMCSYAGQLSNLHNLPDMLFHNNLLRIDHYSGLAVEFNALQALQGVEETKDPLRVAVADGWQSARANLPFARKVAKPFDWTFTTDYRGTLISSIRRSKPRSKSKDYPNAASNELTTSDGINPPPERASATSEDQTKNSEVSFMLEETNERIDVNKLKIREEILFYDDIPLYEDELADHGTAEYSVKVRVMPKSFFILARFYLRIDGLLSRINDTRIYHEFNKRFLLREYTNREANLEALDLPLSIITNPNELMTHLPIVSSCYEKLILPSTI